MKFGPYDLADKVLVVAEIGNNHEGRMDVARELVRQAAASGADAVKFQTFRTEHYVSRADTARFARLKSFELTMEGFTELAVLARSLGIGFISTPFDVESARGLRPLVDCYKIASGDNNFYPLIETVAATDKPLIISTGASDEAQVRQTVAFVGKVRAAHGVAAPLAILHCVSSYPVPPAEANLRAIRTLAGGDYVVGYSDHTIGVEAAVIAVALGARILEKHFTLDKHYSDFRDHQLSADPAEMKDLVRRVREAFAMLGTGTKTIQPCEAATVALIRRSIVVATDLPAGHHVTLTDLTWIRPSGGLAPGAEDSLVGKRLRHPMKMGEQMTAADLE